MADKPLKATEKGNRADPRRPIPRIVESYLLSSIKLDSQSNEVYEALVSKQKKMKAEGRRLQRKIDLWEQGKLIPDEQLRLQRRIYHHAQHCKKLITKTHEMTGKP